MNKKIYIFASSNLVMHALRNKLNKLMMEQKLKSLLLKRKTIASDIIINYNNPTNPSHLHNSYLPVRIMECTLDTIGKVIIFACNPAIPFINGERYEIAEYVDTEYFIFPYKHDLYENLKLKVVNQDFFSPNTNFKKVDGSLKGDIKQFYILAILVDEDILRLRQDIGPYWNLSQERRLEIGLKCHCYLKETEGTSDLRKLCFAVAILLLSYNIDNNKPDISGVDCIKLLINDFPEIVDVYLMGIHREYFEVYFPGVLDYVPIENEDIFIEIALRKNWINTLINDILNNNYNTTDFYKNDADTIVGEAYFEAIIHEADERLLSYKKIGLI